MSEHDPERDEPIGPERERLEPGEIDLTGAVQQPDDLYDVITDAIVEATAADSEIPEWGARAIARHLANLHPDTALALHQFAVTGTTHPEAVLEELPLIYRDPSTREFEKECVNWLGTYLVRARNDGPPPDAPPWILDAIREHGPAFIAYLRLPDVTYDNAVDTFSEMYATSFDNLHGLVADMIATLGLEHLLEVTDVHGTGTLDPRAALDYAREAWDIVELGGRFYLFER